MLVEINNVSKSYTNTLSSSRKREKSSVLRHVTFQIGEHDVIGIVGKSGCGKSTLAHLLVCLEQPNEGIIRWNGVNTAFLKKKELRTFRKECQLVSQDSLSSFNPSLTLQTSLIEPLKNHFSYTKKECVEHILSILPSLSLHSSLLTKLPDELSGGQRQRFNILRALLVQPKLLICDEITAGLDKIAEAKIIQLLMNIQEKTNMAILFISHDLRLVQRFCKKIMIMENGTIVECAEKVNNEFTFSHPHSKILFNSFPIAHPAKRSQT